MIAAVYARKSTDQTGVAEEAKSVTRQIENARAFAAAKGWIVVDAHVFVDDGISGAEFERRPGFMRMMSALQPRAPFQVLIVSEQKSLGREMSETQYHIKRLAEAGVEIVEYVHGRSLTPKNWIDKMMSAVRSGADEAHREQTRERVHEAHTRLARKGYVTGGRVFGYRNVDVFNGVDVHGRPLRSHVTRQIDEAEAAVVRRIFELYASGYGLKRIAKQLTSERAAAPRPFTRKDGLSPIVGWSPSTVRTIIAREIYRGVIVWNRSRKRTDWGKVDQRPRPESDWLTAPAEHLRVVPEDLWRRVASRRRETEGKTLRFGDGRLSGRPPKHATQNLLAGLATCALCGGSLVVETSGRKHGRVPQYVCHRHRHNGTCANALRVDVVDVNEAVLVAVEEHALTPEAIEQVIRLTERDDARDQQAALERERADVDKRIKRLVEVIETGGDATSIVAKLRELEARRVAIVNEIAGARPVPRLAPAVVESRLAEWRRLLRQSTTQGRAVLQRILNGRLTFTRRADGRGYDFSGPTRFDRLFTGTTAPTVPNLQPSPEMWRPSTGVGAEHIRFEDTLGYDYGRLLERAHARFGQVTNDGKWLASPGGVWRSRYAQVQTKHTPGCVSADCARWQFRRLG